MMISDMLSKHVAAVKSVLKSDLPPCTRNNVNKYMICCHNNIITKKFIFLTRDFSCELYVLPDDDKRYAIETYRSSEKCFKKVI